MSSQVGDDFGQFKVADCNCREFSDKVKYRMFSHFVGEIPLVIFHQ